MKRVELKCKCGSEVVFVDERGSYINTGGKPDETGKIYIIDRQVEEWQERHQNCLEQS